MRGQIGQPPVLTYGPGPAFSYAISPARSQHCALPCHALPLPCHACSAMHTPFHVLLHYGQSALGRLRPDCHEAEDEGYSSTLAPACMNSGRTQRYRRERHLICHVNKRAGTRVSLWITRCRATGSTSGGMERECRTAGRGRTTCGLNVCWRGRKEESLSREGVCARDRGALPEGRGSVPLAWDLAVVHDAPPSLPPYTHTHTQTHINSLSFCLRAQHLPGRVAPGLDAWLRRAAQAGWGRPLQLLGGCGGLVY